MAAKLRDGVRRTINCLRIYAVIQIAVGMFFSAIFLFGPRVNEIGPIRFVLPAFVVIFSGLCITASILIEKVSPAGKTMAWVMAVLMLFGFPLGTLLGVITIMGLTSDDMHLHYRMARYAQNNSNSLAQAATPPRPAPKMVVPPPPPGSVRRR